jgi:hypothetical protein
MEYKKYIKVNSNNVIIDSKSSAFVKDSAEWIEAGETDTRQWRLQLTDENFIFKYKWASGQIKDRTATSIKNDTIAILKSNKKGEIKITANQLILSKYPLWKQSNLHSEMGDLLNKKIDGNLTASEATRIEELKAIKSEVDNIRSQSNDFELEVDNLTTVNALNNYTFNYS